MMKRANNTIPCSSSYRENTTNASDNNLHTKSLGCMSGIFHFISKYHHNRKSLTFRKNKTTTEKNIVISSSTIPPSPSPPSSTTKAVHTPPPPDQTTVVEPTAVVQQPPRFSCEVAPDRSPAIPPEIRRSNSVNSPANFRPSSPSPPHSVVSRLMGLTSSVPPESTSEKRRKLMGALEKCDQDLKALKKIIDAVRYADLTTEFRTDPTAQIKTKTVMTENEQPSPVSVLDELTRSPPTLTQTRDHRRQSNEFRVQQENKKKKSAGDELDTMSTTPISLFDRMIKATTTESIPTLTIKRPDEGDVAWTCAMKMRTTLSREMMESVEQVCKDIAWGQNREVGRIGLALQDHICRDLIEEMVKELGYVCCSYPIRDVVVPRFEACKRSLRF